MKFLDLPHFFEPSPPPSEVENYPPFELAENNISIKLDIPTANYYPGY